MHVIILDLNILLYHSYILNIFFLIAYDLNKSSLCIIILKIKRLVVIGIANLYSQENNLYHPMILFIIEHLISFFIYHQFIGYKN